MSLQFLSEEWFTEVQRLTAEVGDIQAPAAIADLKLNLTVNNGSGPVKMCFVGGIFQKGHHSDAQVGMTMPADLAKKIFLENDASAGMQGFMSGQIQIDGDMTRLMTLQSAQPSAKQAQLLQKIQSVTV